MSTSPDLQDRFLLSERERQVLASLANGGTNVTAARELFVSEETIKTHVRHILGKLQVPNRTAAVAVGIRRGIID